MQYQLIKLIFLVGIILSISMCGLSNERKGCDGFPDLLNPIQDLVIPVSQDTLIVDLVGSVDSAFRHTASKSMNFNIQVRPSNIRNFVRQKNEDLNYGLEMVMILENSGTVYVSIIANDDCDKIERDDFVIQTLN